MDSVFAHKIGEVRRFNRFYTNILGLLDQQLLGSSYSLSEIRVLYEIDNTSPCTSKKLIHELKMDSGYLSRMLKRLEKAGLVAREQSSNDARTYFLSLTDQGRETMKILNELSNRQIHGLLSRLRDQEQAQLVAAMQMIEQTLSGNNTLRRDSVVFRNTLLPGDVGQLIQLHGWIYAAECGYNHEFEAYVCQTFVELFEHYHPDKDRFWFVEAAGKMIGAIAIVGHTSTLAQLRWFILHPDYRGMGIGSKLMKEAIQFCRDQNYQTVFLVTTKDQETAVSMYLKAGFQKVEETHSQMWGRDLVEQRYQLDLTGA